MSWSCRRLYVALGAGALFGLTSGACADNWQFLPRVELGGTYSDNYRLADIPDQELEVYGPYIDARKRFIEFYARHESTRIART